MFLDPDPNKIDEFQSSEEMDGNVFLGVFFAFVIQAAVVAVIAAVLALLFALGVDF